MPLRHAAASSHSAWRTTVHEAQIACRCFQKYFFKSLLARAYVQASVEI